MSQKQNTSSSSTATPGTYYIPGTPPTNTPQKHSPLSSLTITPITDTYYVSGTPPTDHPTLGTVTNTNAVPFGGVVRTTMPSTDSSNTNAADDLIGLRRAEQYPSRYLNRTACPGGNLHNLQLATPYMCERVCVNDDKCKMWSYNKNSRQCYLKGSIQPCESHRGYVSGVIGTGGPSTTTLSPTISSVPAIVSPVLPSTELPSTESTTPLFREQRSSYELPGLVFRGVPDRSINVPDHRTCKDTCVGDNNCNRWSYSPNNSMCEIWNGQPYYVDENTRATSGQILSRRNLF